MMPAARLSDPSPISPDDGLAKRSTARRAALWAGAASGASGLLVFLVIHHVWIVPIWIITPIGLPIAVSGGVATGWAYHQLTPFLPQRSWRAAAVSLLIAAVLLPALVLAELRAPLFDVSVPGGAILMTSIPHATAIFVFELLLTATLMGALAGWWIGRTRRAIVATALAGFVFALGPGHNIPFAGGTPGVGKQLVIMAIVIAVAAVVLTEGSAYLARRAEARLARTHAIT